MDSGKLSSDLLFAYMALQNGLLSRDDFVLAMNCWLQDKSAPIKDVIRDRGWLDEESCQVEVVVGDSIRMLRNYLSDEIMLVANGIFEVQLNHYGFKILEVID